MPNVPDDTTPKLNADKAAPNSMEPTENSETVREAFMKAISGNPRFVPAKPFGKAFVILGTKPSW